jgi:hypothetical protein
VTALLASVQTQADAAPVPWPLVVIALAAVVLAVALIWLPDMTETWRRARALTDSQPEPTVPRRLTARNSRLPRQEQRTP